MHPQNLKPWRLYWPPSTDVTNVTIDWYQPPQICDCMQAHWSRWYDRRWCSRVPLPRPRNIAGRQFHQKFDLEIFLKQIKSLEAVTFDGCSLSEVRDWDKDKNDFGQHCCSKESFSDTDYTCTVTPSSKQHFQTEHHEVWLILHKLRILRTRATYIPFLINATLELTRNKGNVYHE